MKSATRARVEKFFSEKRVSVSKELVNMQRSNLKPKRALLLSRNYARTKNALRTTINRQWNDIRILENAIQNERDPKRRISLKKLLQLETKSVEHSEENAEKLHKIAVNFRLYSRKYKH